MFDTRSSISAQGADFPREELSALQIWTVTLGIFSLLTFGLTALPSIICGHLALAQTRAEKRRSLARIVSATGLVIGYVGAAVFGIWSAVLIGHLFH